MLFLQRYVGESIDIGGTVRLKVTEITASGVVWLTVSGGLLDGCAVRRRSQDWIRVADGWSVFVGEVGTRRCKLGFAVPQDVVVKRVELLAA